MKTTAELLKFYGVEPGKKYIVTGFSGSYFKQYINTGFELKYNQLTKDTDVYFYKDRCCCRIHVLDYIDYIEYKEPVLDSTERKYLSAVIKPFRNDVICIQKCSSSIPSFKDKEWITINVKWGGILRFPYFKKDTMYKGMQSEKMYTLEELGL